MPIEMRALRIVTLTPPTIVRASVEAITIAVLISVVTVRVIPIASRVVDNGIFVGPVSITVAVAIVPAMSILVAIFVFIAVLMPVAIPISVLIPVFVPILIAVLIFVTSAIAVPISVVTTPGIDVPSRVTRVIVSNCPIATVFTTITITAPTNKCGAVIRSAIVSSVATTIIVAIATIRIAAGIVAPVPTPAIVIPAATRTG